jgi:putative DNA primase/helicase
MNMYDQTSDIAQDFLNKVAPIISARRRKLLESDGKYTNPSYSIPDHFILNREGVFYTDGKENLWICSHLEVRSLVRDAASKNWGRLLAFCDADGKTHQWSMPMEMLKSGGDDLRGELLRLGLILSPSPKARFKLIEYITTSQPTARAKCVTQTGWHDNVFVFPHMSVGLTSEELIYQSEHSLNYFHEKETLQEWRIHIAKYCVGNSRLAFAVSTAFAAMLLYHSNSESGGIHFVGESSSGKTTALKVAASVYGSKSYVQRWRATTNGLESLAALHSDTLLILDELSQVDPKEAGEAAYLLANGSGKARATKTGTAQTRNHWRILFLSAGEVGIAQHMQEIGKKSKAGQEVRLVDIPAVTNYGIFENLHGFNSGAELSQHLSDSAEKYYGCAVIGFLEKLTADKDLSKFPSYFKQSIQKFVQNNLPLGAGGQAARVCERFALIGIAGELATSYGITGWEKGESRNAAATCFKAWLEHRGGSENLERSAMLNQVRAFFEAHGSSRFEVIGLPNQQITNRVGFKKVDRDNTWFYVLPEAFRQEICDGLDFRMVSKVLLEQGWLQGDSDGKSTRPERLPGMPRTRCYVFTPVLWENA